jgi:hypothetical protein
MFVLAWYHITPASIWTFLMAHQVATYYFISVMIDQLPMPNGQTNAFYRWFFGVIQVLAANWNRGRVGVNGGKTS